MVFVGRFRGSRQGSCGVEYECGEVHGYEAVESNDGRLSCAEGENHVPDGGSIESSKPGAQASRCPVEHGHCDDIGKLAKRAQTVLLKWCQRCWTQVSKRIKFASSLAKPFLHAFKRLQKSLIGCCLVRAKGTHRRDL